MLLKLLDEFLLLSLQLLHLFGKFQQLLVTGLFNRSVIVFEAEILTGLDIGAFGTLTKFSSHFAVFTQE